MSDNLPIARDALLRADWSSRVIFEGGPDRDYRQPPRHWVPYVVPRDTMSPRFADCTAHRVACDCREALLSENRREVGFSLREWAAAADDVLDGHPTRLWLPGEDDPRGCACTGCEIARRAHYYPKRAAELSADTVDRLVSW